MKKPWGTNEAALDIWDCGSPLYDSYELVSLSHQIERHLMKLPSLGGSNRMKTGVTPATIADSTSNVNARAKESSSLRRRLGEFLGSKIWKRRKVCSKEGQAVGFARH